MEVLQIGPGLWRWTGWHEEWKQDVGSVYVETPDGVVLIDPIVPPEDTERFWEALDADVKRVSGQVHVLVSVFWHTRDAKQMVERYRARVWAPRRGRPAIERRAGVVTDAFAPGDALPGGMQALPTARAAEVVYWIPEHRALVPGDVLLTDKQGGIRLCPASWLPASVDQPKLAESLRPLLDLPGARVLPSHGEPLLTRGKTALAAALGVK